MVSFEACQAQKKSAFVDSILLVKRQGFLKKQGLKEAFSFLLATDINYGNYRKETLNCLLFEDELNYSFHYSRPKAAKYVFKLKQEMSWTCFPDSVFLKSSDRLLLSLDYSLPVLKFLRLDLNADAETPLLNLREETAGLDSNAEGLQQAFLSPLECTFSAGIKVTQKEWLDFSLGITAGKFTYIMRDEVLNNIAEQFRFGENKSCLLEYGFTSKLNIEFELGEALSWQSYLTSFKNYQLNIDFQLDNNVTYKAGKRLRFSLKTKLWYDENLQKKVFLQNFLRLCLETSL